MNYSEIDILKKGNKILVHENKQYKECIDYLKEVAKNNGAISKMRLLSTLMIFGIEDGDVE